ncbi:hypothetical protein F5Y17DRAFT_312951 [Xylariaceae sp. FL0594]|nr:hypothetical protein F5Y17DRAFT_312951 [Xylariaceae sp. FL0594]
MAHIASCMIDSDGETNSLRSYATNTFSAKASTDSLVSIHSADEKKPYAWRMHGQEPRRYQLFPKDKPLPPLAVGKALDPGQAFAVAMSQSPERAQRPGMSPNGLFQRIKGHNLTRRRKISVPELGPMTTVQEVSMDSPTIPGRPALHERSISTPVNTLRLNSRSEQAATSRYPTGTSSEANSQTCSKPTWPARQPLSPKDLAPLTIPNHVEAFPSLSRKLSLSRLRSRPTQQEPPVRPPRPDESPVSRAPFTPYTPLTCSSSGLTPKSATTYVTASTLPTPDSAALESRQSPTPWGKAYPFPASTAPQYNSDVVNVPRAESEGQVCSSPASAHRRGQSDSGSIMERGRPRKRADGSVIGVAHRRTESRLGLSAERRAFESLPKGVKPSEAANKMDQADIAHLTRQAFGQAVRFEVLSKEDVDSLSRELRQLDEKTDDLRNTYTKFRAGHRNTRSRVCQDLRSPDEAKVSYKSMLQKQEALAKLDACIDDWATKLEHAENRRTRVRQKLLEHVAAAAAMSVTPAFASETLQQATGMRVQPNEAVDVTTPPRSPAKSAKSPDCSSPSPPSPPSPPSSSSPQRVVARVPSAIIEEENEDGRSRRSRLSSSTQSALQRMESIRIYADSDVYALLEDVENEFCVLRDYRASPEPLSVTSPHPQSYDALGPQPLMAPKTYTRPPPLSPPAPSPPMKDSPTKSDDIFLTSAVFQPQQTSVNA